MNASSVSFEKLVSTLRSHPDWPVIFSFAQIDIAPGYHVTEVKHSMVNSLDCGQGLDQWQELVVQLIDGHRESDEGFMQANKLLHILEKALENTATDSQTQLYFEFAPENTPLQKLSADSIGMVDGSMTITLRGLTTQCKPFQRALASGAVLASGSECCGSKQASEPKASPSCC